MIFGRSELTVWVGDDGWEVAAPCTWVTAFAGKTVGGGYPVGVWGDVGGPGDSSLRSRMTVKVLEMEGGTG